MFLLVFHNIQPLCNYFLHYNSRQNLFFYHFLKLGLYLFLPFFRLSTTVVTFDLGEPPGYLVTQVVLLLPTTGTSDFGFLCTPVSIRTGAGVTVDHALVTADQLEQVQSEDDQVHPTC